MTLDFPFLASSTISCRHGWGFLVHILECNWESFGPVIALLVKLKNTRVAC
jgi:hypothetical protein